MPSSFRKNNFKILDGKIVDREVGVRKAIIEEWRKVGTEGSGRERSGQSRRGRVGSRSRRK